MEMEYSKFMEKTNAVLAHLAVVDVGAIAPAIESAITAGQVEGLTPKQYGQFWAGIRTLCSTLPKDISPIGHGTQSSVPSQQLSYVTSAELTIKDAIVAIGEANPTAAKLMGELIMPARMTANRTAFDDLDDLATYFSNRAGREAVDAYKEKRWNGELLKDGTLGITPKEPKVNTEESE